MFRVADLARDQLLIEKAQTQALEIPEHSSAADRLMIQWRVDQKSELLSGQNISKHHYGDWLVDVFVIDALLYIFLRIGLSILSSIVMFFVSRFIYGFAIARPAIASKARISDIFSGK